MRYIEKIYFRCRNCDRVREVKKNGEYYSAVCVCNEGEIAHKGKIFSLAGFRKDELLCFLGNLDIKWAYGNFVWEQTHPENDYLLRYFDGKQFHGHSVALSSITGKWRLTTYPRIIKGDVQIEFDTAEEAKAYSENYLNGK